MCPGSWCVYDSHAVCDGCNMCYELELDYPEDFDEILEEEEGWDLRYDENDDEEADI